MNIFGYIKVGKRISKAHRFLFEGKTLVLWYKGNPIIGTMHDGLWYQQDMNGKLEQLMFQQQVTHVSFLPSPPNENRKRTILAIIAEIQEERKAAHIVPNHVLATEIINRGFHQPQQALNELCAEGKIDWCRTLNDIAFTIRS